MLNYRDVPRYYSPVRRDSALRTDTHEWLLIETLIDTKSLTLFVVLRVSIRVISCIIARSAITRLACLRHAASVHPEPGSNSSNELALCFFEKVYSNLYRIKVIDVQLQFFQNWGWAYSQ